MIKKEDYLIEINTIKKSVNQLKKMSNNDLKELCYDHYLPEANQYIWLYEDLEKLNSVLNRIERYSLFIHKTNKDIPDEELPF